MRGRAIVFSLLLTVAAALAAVLILVPAPVKFLALLSIVVDEKSFLIMGAALVGGLIAWAASDREHRLGAGLSLVLAAFAFGVALIPPIQAFSLASERNVKLDLKRYLRAPIDIHTARPDQTIIYMKVGREAFMVDVYRPPTTTQMPVPAIVVIHGGGWSSGDKGEAPLASQWLAAQGYAVFDIQYRLAPAAKWTTALGDIKCAIGWVKTQSQEAGVQVDPRRVTLLGRSAGAHLALLAAYTADDPTLPPSCPAPDTHVESVISFYAPTDLVWGYQHPSNNRIYDSTRRLEDFLGGTPSTVPEAYQRASITNRVTASVPRTLLLQGGRDLFVAPTHAYLLAPKLQMAHVAHDLVMVPYGQHSFDFVQGGLSGQVIESVILRFLKVPGPV